jgi:polyhydroxyalkanoate synthesis regulator phasin
MKHLITAAALSLGLLSGVAHAAEPTAQQSKMATCNKDAGDMKGDERKAFMKDCLSAKKETQQSRMTMCNKEAGAMKGDERKKFMSECLSTKKSS